ncbi:hypothetical protein [Desertivirga brevis]|uniref:hypothetical protein n=1 Tax=Desertivirga brevis TaxID=2810310 RepID=UPI001A95CB94|nr:hypothetical protein [Pedobacter sp. SYSU D00873]
MLPNASNYYKLIIQILSYVSDSLFKTLVINSDNALALHPVYTRVPERFRVVGGTLVLNSFSVSGNYYEVLL